MRFSLTSVLIISALVMFLLSAARASWVGAVRKVVGIRGAISSNLRLSDQAARSIG